MAALEVYAIENMEDLYIVQVKNTLARPVTLPRGSVIRFRAFHWDGTVTVDELEIEDDIVITDLRMGMEPFYVFQFKVGKAGNPHAKPEKSKRVVGERGWDSLVWVWHRIWSKFLLRIH